MTTRGFYFRNLDGTAANALRARLNTLAGTLGYTASSGRTKGAGNVAALLQAIDAGEVAVVLLPDEQRGMVAAWLRNEAAAMAANGPLADALAVIAGALEAAADREWGADGREAGYW